MSHVFFAPVILTGPSGSFSNNTAWDILFTQPHLTPFGLVKSSAFLTGWLLDIILVVMVICSLPFVRRSGNFQVSGLKRPMVKRVPFETDVTNWANLLWPVWKNTFKPIGIIRLVVKKCKNTKLYLVKGWGSSLKFEIAYNYFCQNILLAHCVLFLINKDTTYMCIFSSYTLNIVIWGNYL